MSIDLKYIDPECYGDEQDNRLHTVSGHMAGVAYNDLCKMIGGRWPDCRLETEAPKAHKFFMALFSEGDKTGDSNG